MNKICTSIEQSKKLIELGIDVDTADMRWNIFVDDSTRCLPIDDWDLSKNGEEGTKFVPCWSLAALLEIIPSEIFSGEYIINITEGLDNKWCITYDNIDNKNHSFYGLSSSADNLIDACYEMVIKLHERKLL